MWQHGKHSSFFPEFLGSNDKGNGGIWRPGLIKGEGTLSPQGWVTGPCRPLGGRQAPFFSLQGPLCEFEEKKLHFGPVALWGATGGYFWNIAKRTSIFEIFIFFKYKKEKSAGGEGSVAWASSLAKVSIWADGLKTSYSGWWAENVPFGCSEAANISIWVDAFTGCTFQPWFIGKRMQLLLLDKLNIFKFNQIYIK